MKIRLLEVCLASGLVCWLGQGMGRVQPAAASGSEGPSGAGYQALAPIERGNLTVFPVVAATSHDTREFLTLDEGIRSGEVVVTEYGMARSMVRPRGRPWRQAAASPQVNRLVLLNNSNRPLLLLAGEIVTGGKQDRVIAEDRIVPPESDPLDLSVFCVEPGRWTGSSMKFSSMNSAMAAPSVRASAMGDKNQQEVWSQVARMNAGVTGGLGSGAGAGTGPDLRGTTSYAQVMEDGQVAKHVDSMAGPVEQSYSSLIHQLRDRNAVGVVAAVNGQIVWADVFASSDLLERYWPKLVRSYAAQAVATGSKAAAADEQSAQAFLDDLQGKRETVEIEPGLYRHTEIAGDGFKVFELASLLPKTGYLVHMAKMSLAASPDPANDPPRD